MKTQYSYKFSWLLQLTGIVFFLLLFFCATSCKKEDEEPTSESHIIFQDNFDSNDQNWPIFNDTSGMGLIENGKYFLEHKIDDSDYWYSLYLYKDLNGDYTIETSIAYLEGVEDFNYGVIWFRKDNYNHYYLYLTDNKFYIGYIYNYNEHMVSDWTQSESIKTNGEMNKIKIEITVHHFNLFINNELIYEHDALSAVGDEFGYKLQSKGKIAIDNLLIY